MVAFDVFDVYRPHSSPPRVIGLGFKADIIQVRVIGSQLICLCLSRNGLTRALRGLLDYLDWFRLLGLWLHNFRYLKRWLFGLGLLGLGLIGLRLVGFGNDRVSSSTSSRLLIKFRFRSGSSSVSLFELAQDPTIFLLFYFPSPIL